MNDTHDLVDRVNAELEGPLLNGTNQTFSDVVDVYEENGDVYAIVRRGRGDVTYIRREDPVLERVPDDKMRDVRRAIKKASSTSHLDLRINELNQQDKNLYRLLLDISPHFNAHRVSVHYVPSSENVRTFLEVFGELNEQGLLNAMPKRYIVNRDKNLHRMYELKTQVNYVRSS